LQQHRNIEVSGATLECTFYGSGTPVVLLANAGCSTGYFDDLARVLAAGGLQTISVNYKILFRTSADQVVNLDISDVADPEKNFVVIMKDGRIYKDILPK
jgi:hypothetical protein